MSLTQVPLDGGGRMTGPPVDVPVPAPLLDFARGSELYRSPDHPDLLRAKQNLAVLLSQQGENAEAEKLLQQQQQQQ